MRDQIEALREMKDGMASKTCLALDNVDGTLTLTRLARLDEVGYAMGQMACLISARFLQKLASGADTGQWQIPLIEPVLGAISVDQLYSEVAVPDSTVVQAASHAMWSANWPIGSKDLSGFESTKRTMVDLAEFLLCTQRRPVCDLKGAAASSLGTRVSESYLWFQRTGHRTLHGQEIFDALHHRMGRAQLIATHQVLPL
jgi:hypothetical protein